MKESNSEYGIGNMLKKILLGRSVLGFTFRILIYIMLLIYILISFYDSPSLVIKRYLLHPFERKSIYCIEHLFPIVLFQSVTLRILPLEKISKVELSRIFYKRYLGSQRVRKVEILSHHKAALVSSEEKEHLKGLILVNKAVLDELKEIYRKEKEEKGIELLTTPFNVRPEDVNTKIINAFSAYILNGIQQRYKLPQYAKYVFNVRLTFADGSKGIFKVTIEKVSLMPIPSESYHQLRWIISDIQPVTSTS